MFCGLLQLFIALFSERIFNKIHMKIPDTLFYYIVAVNVFTFLVFGSDKRKAKKKQWRVAESRMLFLAAVGGSVGALFGMRVFHHKTRKPKFRFGVPMILAFQIILFSYLSLYCS